MSRSQPRGFLAPTLLILGLTAAAMAIEHRAAIADWVLHSASFPWVVAGVLLLVALGLLAVGIADLVMFLTHAERALLRDHTDPPPVPMHRCLEELPELTDKARTRIGRFTSLIFVLGLLAVPVIALTR